MLQSRSKRQVKWRGPGADTLDSSTMFALWKAMRQSEDRNSHLIRTWKDIKQISPVYILSRKKRDKGISSIPTNLRTTGNLPPPPLFPPFQRTPSLWIKRWDLGSHSLGVLLEYSEILKIVTRFFKTLITWKRARMLGFVFDQGITQGWERFELRFNTLWRQICFNRFLKTMDKWLTETDH